MRFGTKIPVSLSGIASLMEMERDEVREWPYFKEVRTALQDYNLGVLKKERLIAKLYDVSLKCANDKIFHYSTGIENAIAAIRTCY